MSPPKITLDSPWHVVKQSARNATRIYFAPFVGAMRGAVRATEKVHREIQRERYGHVAGQTPAPRSRPKASNEE